MKEKYPIPEKTKINEKSFSNCPRCNSENVKEVGNKKQYTGYQGVEGADKTVTVLRCDDCGLKFY